ncbi:hypothetical protein BJ508DRAFT_308711 [Ascobolus immersus RN42]|uniref:Serine protease n=1 Tax=Ascobolus immersus RN42 TaxID=1160509 RepID=A0A3N4I4F2_ASCIM|nr:hypothetical protein BJ508DRAFT_308711 [Ascobolus immersus RN42]
MPARSFVTRYWDRFRKSMRARLKATSLHDCSGVATPSGRSHNLQASTASKDIITKPSDEGTTGSLMPRPQRESLLISSHNDNRYGLIPQCELNEACPDSDHSKPAGISLKEHVYGIKPVFAKHPQARGTETAGTAFYVGMGYFLTCAHNVAWIGSSAQPQKRDTRRTIFIAIPPLCYEKDAVSKEKRIEVDFVGSAFLDDFKDEGKFYIDDIESPTDRDLAVVKVRPEDMHLFDNIPILKPAYLNMSSPTGIALSAINGACDYTDDEVERYQGEFVPSKDDFEKAVRRLKPGHVTEWMTKSFKSIPNASGDTAYVAFQISTTPGSSGSLLSQDGRLVGMEAPTSPVNLCIIKIPSGVL